MVSAPWISPPEPTQKPEPTPDPDAIMLAQTLALFIRMGASLSARTNQVSIGSSEIGYLCDRRVAYRARGVPKANTTEDPLRTLVGTGVHLALAATFTELDPDRRWFLVETPVSYRGVPGTADLVYVLGRTVVDWKTAKMDKIKDIRRNGVPRHYQTQAHMYGAGLLESGRDVGFVAVVFVPLDADPREGLRNLYAWRVPLDVSIADGAVDRYERLKETPPPQAQPRPDRLCPWCSHYKAGAVDLSVACPGMETTQ